MKNPKLVSVQWVDIIATSGWEKLDEVNTPTMETVGYLVHRDKNCIKVACTKDDKGDWFSYHVFPKGCIKKITNILS